MIARAFQRARLMLGAYQVAEVTPYVTDDPNFTASGASPRVVRFALTTPMDEHFVNRTVTAILTEQAQRDIITALTVNLNEHDLAARADLRTIAVHTASEVEW